MKSLKIISKIVLILLIIALFGYNIVFASDLTNRSKYYNWTKSIYKCWKQSVWNS